MLRNVKWGEYRLGDLFEIESTLGFNSDKIVPGNDYDYITRTSANQGIFQTTGFVNEENINSAGTWSLGLMQMDFFYRERPWYAGQFVRKITPKIRIGKSSALFFSTLLNCQKAKLLSVLVRDVDETFRSRKIQLPIANGEIDFDFIESFIMNLKSMRMEVLQDYLTASGLKRYKLSSEELSALQRYRELKTENWGEYRIGDLFERIETKKLPYKADDLPKHAIGKYTLPCLTSSFQNQGLNYFAPREDATILCDVISIPSNSDVYRAYYQSREFTVLSDAYAIRWKDHSRVLSPNQYLFMVMCINKVTDLPIYSYKNKLGGWNVVREKQIKLPKKDGKIDFAFMETLICAIKKLAIKDVVQYTED